MTSKNKTIETWLLFFLVSLLFLFIRLKDIALPSYWLDEMVSLHFAGHNYWGALFWDNHPPLYHLILKFWLRAFGYGELPVRLLSLLIAFTSMCVLYRFISKQVGNRWGILVVALYSLSAAQVQMAQEARMYALFELAALVNFVQFYYFLKDPKRKIHYALSILFLISTHYLAVLQILFQFGYLALFQSRRSFKLLFAASILWGALVVFVFIDWKYLRWQDQSFQFSSFLSESNLFIKYIFLGSVASAAALIGLSFLSFRNNLSREVRATILMPWVLFLVLILIQVLSQKNTLFVRYYEFIVPMFLISAFAFLSDFASKEVTTKATNIKAWIKSQFGFRLGSVVLLFVSAILFLPSGIKQTKAPWRDVAEFIAKNPANVYTTRTLAIETPYFKRHGIPVLRLDNFAQISGRDEPYWLVESYFNGLAHLTQIKNDLESLGKKSQLLQFRKEESDIVLVLAVNFQQAFDDANWIKEMQSQEVPKQQDGVESFH